MRHNNPMIIGVTGGMGCGQTTVSKYLGEMECKVINADIEAKNVIKYNRVLQNELKKAFGKDIFFSHNKLNTRKLAERAFKDTINTNRLNQLVHPRMVESLIEKMEKARFSGKYPIIVIDAALIYEISIERNFDAIVVVNSSIRNRQKRVFERDKISRQEFQDRISKQIPLEEKCKWADYVIDNNGTLDDLKENTKKVYELLIKKGKEKKNTGKRKPTPKKG